MRTNKVIAIAVVGLMIAAGLLILIPSPPETHKVFALAGGTTWLYRKSHVVNSLAGAGTGYQINVTLHYGSGSDHGSDVYLSSHAATDFSDVRFTASDGTTMLSYWMETVVPSTSAFTWVKLTDNLNSSSSTIYIYYGCVGAASASNGPATFPLFDDFNSGPSRMTLTNDTGNPVLQATLGWEGTAVIETSDFKIGTNSYISWYRGGQVSASANIGFATSTDGHTWSKQGTLGLQGTILPYVVTYHGCYYMFALNNSRSNIYLWNVTNHTTPGIMKGGLPVFYHSTNSNDYTYQIFNVGVAPGPNGVWYMLIEGKKSGGQFGLTWAYSNFQELNWTIHKSSIQVIPNAGNPYLCWVPDRNALMSIYGDISGSYWTIKACYAYPSTNLNATANWTMVPTSIFQIAATGLSIADPDMITNSFSSQYGVMIDYNYNQVSIYQTYYAGSLDQFFDQLTLSSTNWNWTGDVNDASLGGGIITLTGTTTWASIYSKLSFGPGYSVRELAKIKGRASNSGCSIGWGTSSAASNTWVDTVYFGTTVNNVRCTLNSATLSNASNVDTNWNVYEMKWTTGRMDFYKNNASMTGSPITSDVPTAPLPVLLESVGGANYNLQESWLLVHKVTTAPQTQGAYSSEQTGNWTFYTASQAQIAGLETLVVIMLALVIAMPIVNFALQVKEEKHIDRDDLIGMVVTCVVGLVMLGIALAFLGS